MTAPNHSIKCRSAAAHVATDQAIPIGLLVNEFIANSIKYAYPRGSGEVRVCANVIGDRLTLEIADDGIGLPADFDWQAPRSSLGTKVIRSLLQQLRAEFLPISSAQGTKLTVVLKLIASSVFPASV